MPCLKDNTYIVTLRFRPAEMALIEMKAKELCLTVNQMAKSAILQTAVTHAD